MKNTNQQYMCISCVCFHCEGFSGLSKLYIHKYLFLWYQWFTYSKAYSWQLTWILEQVKLRSTKSTTNSMKSMIVLKPKDDHMPKIHIKNNCNIELINLSSLFFSFFFTSYSFDTSNSTHFSFFPINSIFPWLKKAFRPD